MKIEIAGRDLYRQIKTELLNLQKKGEDSSGGVLPEPSMLPDEKKTEQEIDVGGRGFELELYPTKLPLPYSSIDGGLTVQNDRYMFTLDLNPPGILDLDRRALDLDIKRLESDNPKITPRIINLTNRVERCLREVPRALKKELGKRYLRIGDSIAGYFLDVRGNPRAVIERSSETGTIRYRVGGSGLKRLVFGEEPNFIADMDIVGEDITKILNSSLKIALKTKLIRANHDITLRLGAIT